MLSITKKFIYLPHSINAMGFLTSNKQNNLTYISAICFYKGKALIIKRHPSRTLYPGLWEYGSHLKSESPDYEEDLKLQLKNLFGINISSTKILRMYSIKTSMGSSPGIKFICNIESFIRQNQPRLSPEHSEWAFVTPVELNKYHFTPKSKEEILTAFSMLD